MGVAPATVADLVDILDAAGKSPLPRQAYACCLVQVTSGAAWIARGEGDEPLVLGGLYDRPGVASQGWLIAVPTLGGRFARAALGMRQVLRDALRDRPFGVEVQVRRGNRAGERIAASLGFSVTERIGQTPWGEPIESVRVWERVDG